MHHVRGLVRRSGRRALQAVEAHTASAKSASACVQRVRLHDVDGHTQPATLLHSGALLKLTEKMTREDALATLAEVTRLLRRDEQPETSSFALPASSKADGNSDHGLCHSMATPSSSTSDKSRIVGGSEEGVAELYVKDTSAEARAELQRRQGRFIAKLEGRFTASDAAAVEAALQRWLSMGPAAFDDTAVATYRGMVEALAATDAPAAIALAINPSLPSLTTGASAALAALVQLQAPAAVHAFLESFASKDELTLASETTATHLAVRLRKELHKAETVAVPASSSSSSTTASVSDSKTKLEKLLKEAAHFNVDPGIVYPTEPAAIQNWAEQFLTHDMLPVQKSRVLFQHVCERRLLPRRVSVDALSVWTLTDLERPWLRRALQRREAGSSSLPAELEADDVLFNTAYQLALKDLKRNLVDNRLLHVYAHGLARGDISPLDESFSAFLDECGECHSDGAVERPASLTFTLPRVPPEVPLLRALHDLAPQCSYWRTLLTHCASTHVRAYTAPQAEVKVTVQLPDVHECVVAARENKVDLPRIPVLFEDADVMVVDKPAGLATSRHGLSGTQIGGTPVTDLISVLLATQSTGTSAAPHVFRQGQVHRLDVETSGCLIIAKSDVAADSLRHQMGTSAAFSHQSKIYHALCVVLEPSLQNVKLHDVVADAADPKVQTHYRVIKFFPKHRVAWVECRIQQGKKHQIRRHLASRGLPILADVDHGGAACCQSTMSRVALHAHSVSFIHPVSAEPVVVTAPLPADFQRCLAQLQ